MQGWNNNMAGDSHSVNLWGLFLSTAAVIQSVFLHLTTPVLAFSTGSPLSVDVTAGEPVNSDPAGVSASELKLFLFICFYEFLFCRISPSPPLSLSVIAGP